MNKKITSTKKTTISFNPLSSFNSLEFLSIIQHSDEFQPTLFHVLVVLNYTCYVVLELKQPRNSDVGMFILLSGLTWKGVLPSMPLIEMSQNP